MPKEKASRNKTIDTPISEGRKYIARCIEIKNAVEKIDTIVDKTILGDTFAICPLLPKESVDLIIADPPYNLTKSFNGSTFTKKKASEYEEYTRKWLSLVSPLLKPSGSIYVCCDWETSLIIGNVLNDFFKVRSRITWQRGRIVKLSATPLRNRPHMVFCSQGTS
jgi:site-specific DNA-methyltransferase (adenine-specific)